MKIKGPGFGGSQTPRTSQVQLSFMQVPLPGAASSSVSSESTGPVCRPEPCSSEHWAPSLGMEVAVGGPGSKRQSEMWGGWAPACPEGTALLETAAGGLSGASSVLGPPWGYSMGCHLSPKGQIQVYLDSRPPWRGPQASSGHPCPTPKLCRDT